jgi:hypothetical protein
MHRRIVALISIALLVGASGCVMDLSNDSEIMITATETDCSHTEVDVDFEARNNSQSVTQNLGKVVSSEEYIETPPYDRATTELFDTLQSNFDRDEGSIKYDGRCYNVSLNRVYDD